VLGGSLQLAADERTDLRVTLHHADDEYHTPTDGSGNVVDRNAVQSARRFDLGIDIARSLAPRLDARLALAASGSDGGFDDAADGPADTLGFFGYRSIDDVQRRSIDARVDYRAAEGIVVTGGGQVEQKFQHSLDETLSEYGPSTGSFDAERWSRALFAQALVARSGLALNAGARIDDNDAFGAFATFRAGAAYRLPTGTRARVAVGNAFREPTFFQNFATGFVIGNPDLEPEHTRTFEAGVEQSLLNDRVALSATWFRQRFRDLIDYSYDPSSPGRPNYFNIALARADGHELEGHATLGAAWLSAAWTHLDSRVVVGGFDTGPTALFSPGDALVRRPDDTFSATAGIAITSRARIDATAIHVGERADIDFNAFARVRSAGYTTLDLSAEVDVLAKRPGRPWAQVTFRLANALDEEYQAVRGFVSPGRSILAGVRAGF
jgi:vitamin B12 transporter